MFCVIMSDHLNFRLTTVFKFFIASFLILILGMVIPNEKEMTAMVIVPTAVSGKTKQNLSFETLNSLQKTTNLWFDTVRLLYLPRPVKNNEKK